MLPVIGLVAVARGTGIAAAFRELGATRILDGGETGKASAGELLEAARASGREHAVLLPNDKDVLMAAETAAAQAPGFITVISTRSAAAGLAAAVAYQPGGDASRVVEEMREAAEAVRCVEVSRAVRAATVDDVAVREGDAIALVDDVLVAATATLEEALLAGLEAADAATAELVTLYLGAGVSVEGSAHAIALIADRWPHLDVETVEGGQPHYPYIAGVE
jgi:dihydroxyacetone kinase-like predicted kinase